MQDARVTGRIALYRIACCACGNLTAEVLPGDRQLVDNISWKGNWMVGQLSYFGSACEHLRRTPEEHLTPQPKFQVPSTSAICRI